VRPSLSTIGLKVWFQRGMTRHSQTQGKVRAVRERLVWDGPDRENPGGCNAAGAKNGEGGEVVPARRAASHRVRRPIARANEAGKNCRIVHSTTIATTSPTITNDKAIAIAR
jgi:hypothetical protein